MHKGSLIYPYQKAKCHAFIAMKKAFRQNIYLEPIYWILPACNCVVLTLFVQYTALIILTCLVFLVIMFFNFLLHQNNTSNDHHFITLKMNQNGNYKLIPWGEIGIKITLDEEVFKIQMTRKMPFHPEHQAAHLSDVRDNKFELLENFI